MEAISAPKQWSHHYVTLLQQVGNHRTIPGDGRKMLCCGSSVDTFVVTAGIRGMRRHVAPPALLPDRNPTPPAVLGAGERHPSLDPHLRRVAPGATGEPAQLVERRKSR